VNLGKGNTGPAINQYAGKLTQAQAQSKAADFSEQPTNRNTIPKTSGRPFRRLRRFVLDNSQKVATHREQTRLLWSVNAGIQAK
jgi:hypothetical protein